MSEDAEGAGRSPLAGQLLRMAGRRSDGVLAAPGRPDEIHLRNGLVTHVRTGRPAPGPGDLPRAVLPRAYVPPAVVLPVRELFLDGLRELLAEEAGAAVRWRARSRRPLDVSGVRLDVPAALAETARRRAVLDRLAPLVTPGTPLRRRDDVGDAAVRVTPAQWALLARLDAPATPEELARALGDSVFRTVARAYELLRLGLAVGDGASAAGRGPHPAFLTGT